MHHIIRNTHCRCGSGLLSEDCCHKRNLSEKENAHAELLAMASQMEENLISLVKGHYHPEAMNWAWDEFTLHEEGPFSKQEDHGVVFLSWFLYNWIPCGKAVLPDSPVEGNIPIAAAYLMHYRDHIEPEEIRFVERVLDHPFSFFEVVQVVPERGCWIKELFLGDERIITKIHMEKSFKTGDIIFGRWVEMRGVIVELGFSQSPIPPVYRSYILELKSHIEKEIDEIVREDLFTWSADIRALYLDIQYEMQSSPQLKNTDGDQLCMHELFFDIDSTSTAFSLLKDLSDQPEEAILENSSSDKKGELSRVEFVWTEDIGGKTVNRSTLFGHICIHGKRLIVSVNSRRRAESAKVKISERLGKTGHYRATRIQSIISLMKEMDGII